VWSTSQTLCSSYGELEKTFEGIGHNYGKLAKQTKRLLQLGKGGFGKEIPTALFGNA
jgi:hypothetical protein